MHEALKKPYGILLYKERAEFEEFGLALRGCGECSACGAVYHKKSWHHPDGPDVGHCGHSKVLWASLCPACKMAADRQYEGELTIKNIPGALQSELVRMIKSYLKRAYEKDCQHRLIALIKKSADTWVLTFTENQLANKLGRKIKEVFNKADMIVAYSKEPDDVERVKIIFRRDL